MTRNYDTDVLIIGGGPTGLTLALELSLQKIPFRIIDILPSRSPYSRAFALHARSLELLSRHPNIVPQLTSRGTFNVSVKLFSNKKPIFEIELGDTPFSDTVYPGPLFVSQAVTEGVLDEALGAYGGGVEWGVEAMKVEQDEEGVDVRLKRADGTNETVRAKYVVGCDGAHSIVRKSAGLTFEGGVYPQDFILADVKLKWERNPNLHIFIGHYGLLAALPLSKTEGIFRLVCSRPFEKDTKTEPTMEDFRSALKQHVPGEVEISDSVWMTRFKLHHRIASRYSEGRLFVAGDAAHIHSPVGGQGMNTGIQDSVNLGWKLASVLRGESEDSLLDSYHLERHKVGLAILRGTDRVFEIMATTNPVLLWARNWFVPWVVPWILGDRQRRRVRMRFLSQLGIRYLGSPVVGSSRGWEGKLRGGNRAADGKLLGPGRNEETTLIGLLKGPGYHLFLFSGVGANAVGMNELGDAEQKLVDGNDRVTAHRILDGAEKSGKGFVDVDGNLHREYGFDRPGFVLVRPDAYIAFIGYTEELDGPLTLA
ncbi:FAD binding domain-containing protein [Rhexocercosporidium sp. MPI-PUGE-AT-0058]|nr:FAD binding domain-containing protein [Rhexocercosporidium sp. MPI-PUGE-AT-0058]